MVLFWIKSQPYGWQNELGVIVIINPTSASETIVVMDFLGRGEGLVAATHASGKTILLWGATYNYGVLITLLDEGVDWVNTDRLKPFAEYYHSRGK